MGDSEKNLEKELRERCKAMGGWSFKLVPIHVNGLPDRICLFKGGRLFFAEMKSTGDKPSKIQKIVIAKLRSLGFRVEVIDRRPQLLRILKEYE